MPEAHAVFLSYASQDAAAAERICEALRGAGIEVFFDRSGLRGGDAWDQRIRQQIRDCALFVPVISQNTQARTEGYFRLEWRLADQRTHLMGRSRSFLVPVCIDATREFDADVPDSFSATQWTRLPDGAAAAAFATRLQKLLAPPEPPTPGAAPPRASPASAPPRGMHGTRLALLGGAVIALAALGYLAATRLTAPRTLAPAGFRPPAHSVAVLPFVNMSGDRDQDYFSDGLTEELLNSLARIEALQVAARTSAFSFKGKQVGIDTIAHQLNVASILEGSVRRSGHTVRVTAQLIDAVSGFHAWSQTYDRDLGDVLKLQTDIANAVAAALKVTLLKETLARVDDGGTRNPAAFDAYLRGVGLARFAHGSKPMNCRPPIDAFGQAIALDPAYALAYAHRALMTWDCATNSEEWLALKQPDAAITRADAGRAIELAPGLGEGYLALSSLEEGLLNFAAADEACTRALALAPGNALILSRCSLQAAYFGHAETALAGTRHAATLDPLDPQSHRDLGNVLHYARRYEEAIAAYQAAIAVDPEHAAETHALMGLSYYLAGNLPLALQSCERYADEYRSQVCRPMVYERLGRHADAVASFAALRKEAGEASAYQYSQILAQWGKRDAALAALEQALKLRDPGLAYTLTDPLLDPLRNEPRFQDVLRSLKFPAGAGGSGSQ